MLKAQQRQSSYADTKRREVTFSVGVNVLLSTKNSKLNSSGARKLLPRFVGPFNVMQRVGAVAYKLALPMNNENSQRLSCEFASTVQPLLVLRNGELEFEVDRVLDHRVRKTSQSTTYSYLMKWTGYGPEHNSWEPERNAPESLRNAYWKDMAKRSTKRKAPGRACSAYKEPPAVSTAGSPFCSEDATTLCTTL